ncbi:MAG TPA: tetratricopeptide repeat protein, partial [Rhodanobacteraceae bacterium]|nr:tetratricopeptide repeat protein [Rhodanobacteraceae bacterium]
DVQHAAVDNAAQTRSAPFSWIDPADQKPKSEPTHTRLILLGALGLLVLLAVGTGFYLSNTQQPDVAPIAAKAAYQAPRITRGTPHAAAVRAAAYKGSGARSVVGPYHATAVQKTVAAPTAIPGAGAATRANPFQRVAALASGGNARAEEVLGLDYLDGDGVAVNEAEGAKWLERAAAQGEAVAAWRLGTLYERGHGVAADPAKATQWYAVAARAGNRKAMHNLAVAYAQGSGIAKDLPLAVQWFSRAANLGLADSQFNLAVLYERGLGVPPSLAKAYKWYAVAAAEGDAESRARMEAIAPQLSAADKAAAEKFRAQFQPARLDAAANVPPVAASMQ